MKRRLIDDSQLENIFLNVPGSREPVYNHVVQTFFNDDEEQMLDTLAFGRVFFESVLNVVDSVPLPRQGRPGFVFSHKD